jgi:hypothetical protein
MRNLPVALRRINGTYTIGFLLIFGALASSAFWMPSAHRITAQQATGVQPNRAILVANRTQSIEVVTAERDESSVHLVLRNNSYRSVDGLQVRVGDVTIQTEFLGTDFTFPPGGLHEENYPTQTEARNRGVTLLCVMFEDGSSEGDAKYIKQIEDTRLGEMTQTRRALLLIDKALAHSNINAEVLENLKREISLLPDRDSDNDNDDVLGGLQNKKAQLISQIEGIRSSQALVSTSGPQELIDLKARLNRSIKP